MRYITLSLMAAITLWVIKEIKEAKDFGLLSNWHY